MPIIAAGSIQVASTVVGISFLTVYGWVNLAAFLERVSGNPSFRPTSKGHWLISLYGFFICILGVVLFNPLIGLCVLVFQFSIFFLLLRYRSGSKLEGVWWGVLFKMIQWTLQRLGNIVQGTKNWRPIMQVFAYSDRKESLAASLGMADQISSYKGLTMVNIFSVNDENEDETADLDYPVIPVKESEVESGIISIAQSMLPGKFQTNTVLLPMDKRLNLLRITEHLIEQKKHVLLYLNGKADKPEEPRIDIWWKGESNGNLMALLGYIITQSETESWHKVKPSELSIRFIRKLYPGEEEPQAREELLALMNDARLAGSVLILPADEQDFYETVCEQSRDATLVVHGMPGQRTGGITGTITRFFALDELFFSSYFEVYKDMPSMLFVKASHGISLSE